MSRAKLFTIVGLMAALLFGLVAFVKTRENTPSKISRLFRKSEDHKHMKREAIVTSQRQEADDMLSEFPVGEREYVTILVSSMSSEILDEKYFSAEERLKLEHYEKSAVESWLTMAPADPNYLAGILIETSDVFYRLYRSKAAQLFLIEHARKLIQAYPNNSNVRLAFAKLTEVTTKDRETILAAYRECLRVGKNSACRSGYESWAKEYEEPRCWVAKAKPTLQFIVASETEEPGTKPLHVADGVKLYSRGEKDLGADDVESLDYGFNETRLRFNEAGARKIEALTKLNYRKRLLVIVDGKVLLAPTIRDPITSGEVVMENPNAISLAEAACYSALETRKIPEKLRL